MATPRATQLRSKLDGNTGVMADGGQQGYSRGAVNCANSGAEKFISPGDAAEHVEPVRSGENLEPMTAFRTALRREKVVTQGHELIATAVMQWLLNEGGRHLAPKTEKEEPVSSQWVTETSDVCLKSILEKLKAYSEYGKAVGDLEKSMGYVQVDVDWLLVGPTPENMQKARDNYKSWDPALLDFEWETERRILRKIAHGVLKGEKNLLPGQMGITGPLRSAALCLQMARSCMAGGGGMELVDVKSESSFTCSSSFITLQHEAIHEGPNNVDADGEVSTARPKTYCGF